MLEQSVLIVAFGNLIQSALIVASGNLTQSALILASGNLIQSALIVASGNLIQSELILASGNVHSTLKRSHQHAHTHLSSLFTVLPWFHMGAGNIVCERAGGNVLGCWLVKMCVSVLMGLFKGPGNDVC